MYEQVVKTAGTYIKSSAKKSEGRVEEASSPH